MKNTYICRGFTALMLVGALGCGAGGAQTADNGEATPATERAVSVLSASEQAEGFRALFDGSTLAGWRGYGMDRPPAGWRANDGVLQFTPGREGGDLMTVEQFADFELRLDWKLEAGGNSGVFFHVVEGNDYAYESGPEMQILDDDGHPDGRNPLTSNGSNYALNAPSDPPLRPVGEWNEIRIRVQGPHVQHWLNGSKVVDYQLWTEEWSALVEGSKFIEMPGYGLARSGHIDLQDHGDPVWYRNIRIRVLD